MSSDLFYETTIRRRQSSWRAAARRAARAQAKKDAILAAARQRRLDHDPREPRPELLHATQFEGPIQVPLSTIPSPPGCDLPRIVIDDEADIHRFVSGCFGAPYQPGSCSQYFCPRHPELDDSTVSLIEFPGAKPLVHCTRCGYRWGLVEFLVETAETPVQALRRAACIWPEKVTVGELDEREIARIQHRSLWRAVLQQGRLYYVERVAEDGLPTAFGDWSFLTGPCLATLLAEPPFASGERLQLYLLQVMRSWAGEIRAVDIYTQSCEPLFRHWLAAPTDGPLFSVPTWADHCDPSRLRWTCSDRADAHALELEAAQQAPADRRPVWLRCGSPPVRFPASRASACR